MLALAPLLLALALALAAALAQQQEQDRVVRYGPGAADTARVPAAALELLRLSPAALSTAHPALAGVDGAFLAALAARPNQFTPGFIDITDNEHLPTSAKFVQQQAATYPTPNATKYPELVDLFAQVSAEGLGWTVGNLSNFTTRYYRSTNARAPALWLQQQFAAVAGAENVVLVENAFDQPNVIAAIPRAEGSTNDEIVVIGGHFDSINQRNSSVNGRAPGADDDASGVAVAFQALQILAAAGFRGQRRIEIHAYAGEEGGLLGSTRTASQYKTAGKSVRGMVEFEMVAYQKGSKPVIAMTDDTAPDLQTFIKALVPLYVPEATFRSTHCGYGCSDHDSWYDQGYNALTLAEAGPNDSGLNPYYHTANDTPDKLDFTKAAAFVKAALAFVVELSEHAQ